MLISKSLYYRESSRGSCTPNSTLTQASGISSWVWGFNLTTTKGWEFLDTDNEPRLQSFGCTLPTATLLHVTTITDGGQQGLTDSQTAVSQAGHPYTARPVCENFTGPEVLLEAFLKAPQISPDVLGLSRFFVS